MKQLMDEQAQVVVALLNLVSELSAWPSVERTMRDDWGILDPDQATDELLKLLE